MSDDPISLEALLKVKEVASVLNCHERTVHRLVKSGRLAAVRTTRHYRFRREDVNEFLRHSLTTRTRQARGPRLIKTCPKCGNNILDTARPIL